MWEIVSYLVVTIILTGLIGVERRRKSCAADVRTHILVGLGSCLMMLLSKSLLQSNPGVDITRIPSQVVSGIGFLGAGTIIKHGNSVKGLTTAAGLWVVCGIGLAVGAGYLIGAVLTTSLALFSLVVFSYAEKKSSHRKGK